MSDAAKAETAQDLARLLRQLRRQDARHRNGQELTYRELATACGWSLGVVGEYFVGTVLPPTDRFDILIQLLGATPVEQRALATARDRVEERRRSTAAASGVPGRGTGRRPPARACAPADNAARSATGASRAILVPHQLPAVPRNFTGRVDDLVRLDSMLPDLDGGDEAAGSSSTGMPAGSVPPENMSAGGVSAPLIVAISGTPGVGKTTLAVVWARRVQHRFPDGQLYANLRGYDPGQPATADEVLDGFLRALNVAPDQIPPTLEDRSAMYRSLLDGRRLLVLLDNAGSAEQVRPLLPGSPSCPTVITSRVRLAGLAISPGASQLELDLLPDDDALTLLRSLLGDCRADVDPNALHRVIEACDRLPLALRVLGQRAAALPRTRVAALAEELAVEPRPLDVLSAGTDEVTAVRSVFSWSYRDLPAAQARAFRLVSTHPGTDLSTHAAAAIVDLPVRQTRLLLDDLTDAHLIDCVAGDRYRFHDLLRAYARERAEADEHETERHLAIRRLVGYYLHTAASADRILHPGRSSPEVGAAPSPTYPVTFADYDEALAWCESERPSLIGVTRLAVSAGMPAAAWQLTANMWSFLYIRKYWTDWVALSEVGLAAATRSGDIPGRARMLNCLATAYLDLRRFDEAFEHFRQVLELGRELGNPTHGNALINLCATRLNEERYDEALEYGRQAVEAFQSFDSDYHRSIAVGNLAEAYLGLGQYEKALEGFRVVLEDCQRLGHRFGEGLTMIHLGEANLGLNRHGEAIDVLTRALDVCAEVGDTHGRGTVWKILGEVHAAAGRPAAARNAWQTALEIFETFGSPVADEVRTRLRAAES